MLADETLISLHATVRPRGVLGWLPYLLLRVQLARVAAGFLQDLRYYVEHGRPSPRKQRQLDTSKAVSHLAEPFEMSDNGIPKGAVVTIDDENPGRLKLTSDLHSFA